MYNSFRMNKHLWWEMTPHVVVVVLVAVQYLLALLTWEIYRRIFLFSLMEVAMPTGRELPKDLLVMLPLMDSKRKKEPQATYPLREQLLQVQIRWVHGKV